VTVRFVNAGVETQTDSKGHFLLSVPTPEPEHPGGAGTDTLTFEKPGYKTLVFENFAIATEEMGPVSYGLEKGKGVIREDATHKLMRKEGAGLEEEPQSATPGGASLSPELYQWLGSSGTAFPVGSATDVAAAEAITVPGFITVGTGGPSDPDRAYEPCSGTYTCTNVRIFPLEDYVSDGLPGEWEAWWAADSLKAGSVAYRSYGAYFVANPACPYVGAHNGQCTQVYDICNTTACQKYNPRGFPSNKASRAAVSATAGVVLSRDSVSIIKAEYAAEGNLASETYATCPNGQVGEPSNPTDPWPCMKDFVCTGKQQASTHSRGMCQRGSQRWASGLDKTGAPGDTNLPILNSNGVAITPRDWRCILDHYYNASSNSKTADPNGTGDPGAGSGLRTAFLQGQPIYGQVAYEDISGPVSIRVANSADGSEDRLLVSSPVDYPTWEPGGRRIAYRTANGIAIKNADGTGQPQMITTSNLDFAPSWSPLGDKIAFCSYRAGQVDVWMVNSDGSGSPQQISHNVQLQGAGYETEDCYLRWSPDGMKIAFTGLTAEIPGANRYNVYSMNSADGSNVTQLTNCQINNPSFPSVCSTPSWSPDGSKIAFSDGNALYGDNIGGAGIYIMDPNGANITPLFQDNNAISVFPHWSTEGKKIIFSYDLTCPRFLVQS